MRLFVENQGNEPVFFHIVGEILDRVTQGNRVQSAATETWLLGGSQGMIVDLVFDEPGFECVTTYFDDICVASDTYEQHLKDIEKILKRCEEVGLRLNERKCK